MCPSPSPSGDRMLTKVEVATRLKRSVSTVDKMRRQGILEYVREHGRVRFPERGIERYLASTWADYWKDVERFAARGPLPTGPLLSRIRKLLHSGSARRAEGPAPSIKERDA